MPTFIFCLQDWTRAEDVHTCIFGDRERRIQNLKPLRSRLASGDESSTLYKLDSDVRLGARPRKARVDIYFVLEQW
jgi:hypothetical protein